jgi:HAMP domain-containing protein
MSKIYSALIKAQAEEGHHRRIALPRKEKTGRITPLNLGWADFNLEWKLVGIIAGTLLVFGILFVAIVNQLIGRALRAQIDQRALVMATNLSDAAAGHVVGRNLLELHALVIKYARLAGSAYAFIEDGKGQIVAHSLGTFPPELRESLTMDDRRQVSKRVVSLPGNQGKTVYETRVPILEGQLGVARVGIWEEAVATEISGALLPIAGLITILVISGGLLAFFLSHAIIRPIRWLTDMAHNMSTGDLETPFKTDSQDELGELARSLERMRASLKAAMVRGLNDDNSKTGLDPVHHPPTIPF